MSQQTIAKPKKAYCIKIHRVIECDAPFKDNRLCEVCIKYDNVRSLKK